MAEHHMYVHIVDTGPLLRRLARVETLLALTLRAVIREGNLTMGAIEDLQAVDAELADVVLGLSGAVDRIDADFLKLEEAVKGGADPAVVAEQVAKLRTILDDTKAIKGRIDITDPVPAPPGDGGTEPPPAG